MPRIRLLFYQDDDGRVPVKEWLEELLGRDRKAFANCVAVIRRLAEFGHELRRPQADYLKDGIYELRAKKGHVNYRILYFFHGRDLALLAHALTKEDIVPNADIARALERKQRYETEPRRHTYEEDTEEG